MSFYVLDVGFGMEVVYLVDSNFIIWIWRGVLYCISLVGEGVLWVGGCCRWGWKYLGCVVDVGVVLVFFFDWTYVCMYVIEVVFVFWNCVMSGGSGDCKNLGLYGGKIDYKFVMLLGNWIWFMEKSVCYVYVFVYIWKLDFYDVFD